MLTELEQAADREARHALRDLVTELEAKLAKAEDFIRRLERFAIQADDKFLIEKSQEVLAELTGGKDAE